MRAGFARARLGDTVTSVLTKLPDDFALQAVREQREAGSEGKESEARENRAPRTVAGGIQFLSHKHLHQKVYIL